MGLSRLGKYIKQLDKRNDNDVYGEKDVIGISTQKAMMKTKANLNGVKLTSYKLFPPNHFVFVPDTSRRGDKMSLCFNNTDKTYIVSSIYIVFYVKDEDSLKSYYLFMYFNRPEFDRYSRYNSWGSARETFSWEDMCDIEMELPSIDIQQKYVDVYNAMVANQQCYERGLEDLKFTCDAYIEKSKNDIGLEKLGKYITQRNVRNMDNSIKRVMGLSTKKIFREPQSRVNKNELSKYKIVRENEFAFVPTTDTWKVLAFSYNTFCEDIVVSPIYEVFSVDLNNLLPGYLAIWLSRKDFDRYARLHSWGSARENFSFEEMCDVDIPIPSIDIQQDIVNIYNAYNERKNINERLKKQIKDICPILIKGSIEEGKLDKGV